MTHWLLYLTISTLTPVVLSDTTVYRSVDKDGTVVFSDQPSAGSYEQKISDVTVVPAVEVNPPTQNAATKPLATEDVITTYQRFEIVKPEASQAFNSGNGNVQVEIAIEPPLSSKHSISAKIDGQLAIQTQSPTFVLPNVDRGTHVLQVDILDAKGRTLLQQSSTFTVLRPRVARP